MPVRDIEWIKSVLPHRYPFLLVDRVEDIVPEKKIVAVKNFTINEPFFQGHFPDHPVVPGVLLIEGLAQTGAILLMYDRPGRENDVVYFMSIDRARFRRPVTPGDQAVYEVEAIRFRKNHCKLRGRVLVDGLVAAEAICSSATVSRDRAAG